MKSKPYWLNRAIDRQSTIDKLSQAELNEIKKIYDNAERDFVKMINEIYESYSKQTGLDTSELKKLMSFNETDKFWKSMEGKNMKQYVMKNYKARITRLEALQAQLQMKCNDIAKRQAHIMNVAGKSAVNFSFSKTVYDTSIGVNTDLSFATLDERTIDLILKEKWLGSNYSERVWKNTDLLAKNLQNILTKAVMTGASYSRTTMELRDKMGVGWNAAERLVRTEMNHFHNQAELQAYEEMGVEMYVFVATLDNRTSQICQQLDGKKFKLSEAKEGVNYPPMHPYCRSTVRAYISDDVEKSLKRRARDENGKNTVVDNMSYSEWANKNVQEDVLANVSPYQSGTVNVKSPTKITNRAEAEQLIKDIGFGSVEKNIDQIDEKLLIENVEQLELLNNKFKVLDSNNTGYFTSSNVGNNTIACVHGSVLHNEQSLSLCQKFYHDRDFMIKTTKKDVESKWAMACLEKDYPIYSITHEYGHILEHKIMRDRIDIKAVENEARQKMVGVNLNVGMKKRKEFIKKVEKEESKKIFNEIIQIVKDNKIQVSTSEFSRYGKTDYCEAFAEMFANSQLGSPNGYGKAMNIWLERNGYGK